MKRLASPHFTLKRFENLLTRVRSEAIEHLVEHVDLIEQVWNNTATLFQSLNPLQSPPSQLQESIMSMPEFHQENSWTTFHDKLITYEPSAPNTLHIYLFAMLLQELTSKGKDWTLFWTPAHKGLSENLLLPIEIDSVDLVSNSLKVSSKKAAEKLPFLTMKPIKVQSKNSQKTYFQLSTFTAAGKWENVATEANKLKTLSLRLCLTKEQKGIIDEWFYTADYVFNKAVKAIRDGHDPLDEYGIRDKLVTSETRTINPEYQQLKEAINGITKTMRQFKRNSDEFLKLSLDKKALQKQSVRIPPQHNPNITAWEAKTPKDIRLGAVADVVNAYKTGEANRRAGRIRFFRVQFRKRDNTAEKSCVIPRSAIKLVDGQFRIFPSRLKESIPMANRDVKKHGNLTITHDCRLVKRHHHYYLIVPIPIKISESVIPENYVGVDPGVKTFMTAFGNNGCIEYEHNNHALRYLDKKLAKLKRRKKRTRKRMLDKIDAKKASIVNRLHWLTINNLLEHNDLIIYGDIKSHDIVKRSNNPYMKRDINNLKFYQFKQRLLFKAMEKQKKVVCIDEKYTTKTCSCCGTLNDPGCLKVYSCSVCQTRVGRDVNAAKNILMKGLMQLLQ